MSQRAGRDSALVSTLLVKTGELAAELAQDRPGDPGEPPVLLDVRWRLAGPPGIDSYRQGHLPGAVFADLDRDLAAPPGPAGRHPLPAPAASAGARYRGETEPVDPVAGHIPGAVSAPTAGNVTPDGTFKDPAGLAARFAGLGAVPGAPVGAYCGSGVTAAHEVLALALAG